MQLPDKAEYPIAMQYVLDVLRAQPDLIKPGNTVGTPAGKTAGEFIAALHAEVLPLVQPGQK